MERGMNTLQRITKLFKTTLDLTVSLHCLHIKRHSLTIFGDLGGLLATFSLLLQKREIRLGDMLPLVGQ